MSSYLPDVNPDHLVAINPLGWYYEASDRDDPPTLGTVLSEVRAAGFRAVHADPPADMDPGAYRALLDQHGLLPAPGYFQARFDDPTAHTTIIEDAAAVARRHAELGQDRIFVAQQFGYPARLARPAIGADGSEKALTILTDGIGLASEAMVAEGVRPCLHQHVGTLLETGEELEAVLSAVPDSTLGFGPDTGHLTWAGIDPVGVMERWKQRIGAVHIKDVRRSVVTSAKEQGWSYKEAGRHGLWTEPGRGDVDFDEVLQTLADFTGWVVIEVDIPDQPTPLQSAQLSWDWVRQRFGEQGFSA